MKTKIIFIFVISLCIILQLPVFADEGKYTYEKETLVSLGLTNEAFDENSTLKRKEFAEILASFLKIPPEENTSDTGFVDVSPKESYAHYVRELSDRGILCGDLSGNFNPEENVSSEQAIKTVVNILGYSQRAENNGGYPRGYYLVAGNIGLTNGVNAEMGEDILLGELYKIMVNALDKDIMTRVYRDNGYAYEVCEGKTYLTEVLDMGMVKGIVSANENTSLSSDISAGENSVIIDGESYYCADTSAAEYLGYKVIAYYSDYHGGGDTLVYIAPENKKNNVISLTGDDIDEDTTVDEVKYTLNSRKGKSAKIKGAAVIYNGHFLKNYSESNLKIGSGDIKLIDNNRDGKYEVIIVNSYSTYVVDHISEKYIDLKYNEKPISLYDYDEAVFFSNGKEIQRSGVSEWSIIDILASDDKSKISVNVSNDKIYGTITEKGEDYIVSGGEKYEFGNYFKALLKRGALPEIKAGEEYIIYLDTFGKAAALKKVMTNIGENFYAYLIEGRYIEDGEREDMYSFKLLYSKTDISSVESVVKTHLTADNIRVDGEKFKNLKAASKLYNQNTHKFIRQLVKVKINDKSEITSIVTAKDKFNKYIGGKEENGKNPDYVDNYIGCCIDDFTLDFIVSSGTAYRGQNQQTFEATKFKTNGKTIIFNVSDVEDADDDEFQIFTSSYLKGELSYPTAYIYDTTDDFNAGIIVLKKIETGTASGVDSVKADDPMVVVDSIVSTINHAGDVVDAIKGTDMGGNEITVVPAGLDMKDKAGAWNLAYYGKKISDLPRGSIVQYRKNSRGEMLEMRILFIPDENSKSSEKNNDNTVSEFRIVGQLYAGYGKAIKTSENSIIFNAHYDASYPDGIKHSWDRNLMSGNVVEVNAADKIVRKAALSEIRENDRVFVTKTYNWLANVVVYK